MGTGTGIGNFSFFLVVSEPVSEKFVTGKSLGTSIGFFFDSGTDFRRQNLGILKIYNGYRYRYREFNIFSGGIGTGIGKIWYRKKSRNRYRNFFDTGTDFCR